MFQVRLLNLPFATLNLPSLALTQLQSVLRKQLGDRLQVEILYLNQDLVRHVGLSFYQYAVESLEANSTGLGDWLFRQVAFPELSDNAEQYFQRCFPSRTEEAMRKKRELLEVRRGLDQFLDELVDRYSLDQVHMVGFTNMFQQNMATFAMARKLKQRRPDLVTVTGGANCETPMGEEIALHVDQIDFVFSGPALVTLPRFVQHLIEGEREACHTLRGVFSRKNLLDGSKIRGSIGDELDINVPIALDYGPFLDTLEGCLDGQKIPPRLHFETSRGCWWGERAHCTFCGLNGSTMAYRAMEPALALTQIRGLIDRYGDRCDRFESVDNILPRSYLREVLPALRPPKGISLFYEIKADMPEEDLEILASAGVTEVQPGIESLSTNTLKLMKKGTTAFHNVMLLKHCRTHGVFPLWNLLVGFPGEQEDVYEKYARDLPLLTHLSPPDGVNPVRFDRYSPYFDQREHYGLDLHPYDYYGLLYPFSEDSLMNLAYYFMDHNIEAEYFLHMARWLDRLTTLVEGWRARWGNAPGSEPPVLVFGEEGIVLDTRSGERKEHQISVVGLRILEALDHPRRLSELVAPGVDPGRDEIEGELARLQQLGLIFEERGRYLSLVLRRVYRASRGRTLIYGLAEI